MMRPKMWMLILTLSGCTRTCSNPRAGMAPEKVVESYLDIALNMNSLSQREDLLQYTTGRLKEAIAAASEETINNAYIKRRYKLETYSVVERRDRTPRETEITFRLKYQDLGQNEVKVTEAPTVTTENTVAVIKEKGAWYIRDVIGNKTSIDFPVSEESKITARPGPGIDTPEEE